MIGTDNNTIENIVKKYLKGSLWLVCGISLIILLIMSITFSMNLLIPLIICVLFAVISLVSYIKIWEKIKKNAPNALTKFYLIAPALRMLFAVLIMVVYCLIVREIVAIRNLVIVFFVYYIAIILFEGVFFARLEKSKKK